MHLRQILRLPKRRLEFLAGAALVGFLVGHFVSPAGAGTALLALVALLLSSAVLLRWLRWGIRKLIWRLRNRLLVAYVFIAVVPVVLLVALAAIGAWILAGQIAVYVVASELDRRAKYLAEVAEGLAITPASSLADRIRWVGPYLRSRHPGFQLTVSSPRGQWRYPSDSSPLQPPAGWADNWGPVVKDGALYVWAHVIRGPNEVTFLAPLDKDAQASLAPQLGEVSILGRSLLTEDQARSRKWVVRERGDRPPPASSRLPPPAARFDPEVDYAAPVAVSLWDQPNRSENYILFVRTRWSAVLRTVFGQTVEWREGITSASVASVFFLAVAGAFLIVELASLLIGINLTRTITRAVHHLYTGTQRVMQGDFTHRIPVRGSDQLAELGHSFNLMSENLGRLLEIAREKERLQTEIEIAREVQNQLFPRAVPPARTLRLEALCRPARLVSGDYYDYLSLPDSRLALAIGDVAGKGISAALLMATVQSSMRAQLRAACEQAGADGPGSSSRGFCTAELVSRLNQHLHAFTPPEKFATFFLGIYDDATGLLVYTNAGHPPPVLIRKGEALRLEINGMVVGAIGSATYTESSLRLEAGDLLVCFTDGVTEPENEYGEMFGEPRLIELLLRYAEAEPEAIVAAVEQAVHQWTGAAELQDDLTLLVARRI